MTDIQLRMVSAGLMGWANIGVLDNQPYGIPPEGWMPDINLLAGFSWDNREKYILPDYPNNMSDAWMLVDRLEELGYETIFVNCADDNLKAVRVVKGVAAPFPPKDMLDHPVYFSKAVANVQDEKMARAITRAFIEVMEERGHNEPEDAFR